MNAEVVRLHKALRRLSCIAKDDWITVHPNGAEAKGQHVLLGEGGTVMGGMGGKFNGKHISEAKSNGKAANSTAKPSGRKSDGLQKRYGEMQSHINSKDPMELAGEWREAFAKIGGYSNGEGDYSEQELRDAALMNVMMRDKHMAGSVPDRTPEEIGKLVDQELAAAKQKRAEIDARKKGMTPESVAGASRGKPMGLKEADGTSVNPHFGEGDAYSTNCQTCVVAYEMRCRGYDLEAKPFDANGVSGKLSLDTPDAFISVQTGEKPAVTKLKCGDSTDAVQAMELVSKVDEVVKPGERYVFENTWKGLDYGHVINVAKDKDGELYFIDSQSGMFLKRSHAVGYFLQAQQMDDIKMFRTDNAVLNMKYADALSPVGR